MLFLFSSNLVRFIYKKVLLHYVNMVLNKFIQNCLEFFDLEDKPTSNKIIIPEFKLEIKPRGLEIIVSLPLIADSKEYYVSLDMNSYFWLNAIYDRGTVGREKIQRIREEKERFERIDRGYWVNVEKPKGTRGIFFENAYKSNTLEYKAFELLLEHDNLK